MVKYLFWLLGMAFLICTGLFLPLMLVVFIWAFIKAPSKSHGNMQDNNAGNDGVGD